MRTREQYNIALSFWTASFQYLRLVENVTKETTVQGNTWMVIKNFDNGPITPEEYEEATCWSDHTIIIPLLFNHMHGIELLVKGFLLTHPKEDVKKSHDILDLCNRFSRKFPKQTQLNQFFQKYTCEYVMPDILKQFLKDNNVDAKSLYQALRYPSPDF